MVTAANISSFFFTSIAIAYSATSHLIETCIVTAIQEKSIRTKEK